MYDWFRHRMRDGIKTPPEEHIKFYEDNEFITPDLSDLDDPALINEDGSTIMDETVMPWIPVPINVPHKDILDEALRLLYTSCFTDHRPDANGWKSVCIHGLGSTMTGTPDDYDLEGEEADLSDWCDIAKYCPKTVQWMQDEMRYKKFSRVRFMALMPTGWIGPHTDRPRIRGIGATNVAINNPDGCDMVLEGVGKFPWEPGVVRKINTGYKHAVWNRNEEEPRIHMIFDGHPGPYFQSKVKEGYVDMLNTIRSKKNQ